MTRAEAPAKVNLALVVGPLREDGKHEVVSVLEAIDLHDVVELEPADAVAVEGYPEDTLVRTALGQLAQAAGAEPGWRVRIDKRIPVAAGLGGGSSDAAAALRLANGTLVEPLEHDELHRVAARVGADVPFFLHAPPQLAAGDGTDLTPVDLPRDYVVVVLLPYGHAKESTAAVYEAFDARDAAEGFEERRRAVRAALARVERSSDLAHLPPNDLASSPLTAELEERGAFRADVTGAGPAVYGLFERLDDAERAAAALAPRGSTWVARPVASC